jgi:hypothetical protein
MRVKWVTACVHWEQEAQMHRQLVGQELLATVAAKTRDRMLQNKIHIVRSYTDLQARAISCCTKAPPYPLQLEATFVQPAA